MENDSPKQRLMNRRLFLAASGGAALALLAGRGLAGASGRQSDQPFIETTCGPDPKAGRAVLIAYASRCGSTGSIAQAMAEALCARGAPVEVRLVKKVQDLSPYRAVIVGSAIRAGKWLPEAAAFVQDHQEALGRLPVAYFVACMTMREDTPENRQKVLAYLDPVRESAPGVKPALVGLFPGVVDYGKLSFVTKAMLQAKGVPEGDFRNLPAVKSWAAGVGPALAGAPPRT